MQELKDSITVKIKDNEYNISYPTVGDFIKIRSLVNELTYGQASNLTTSFNKSDLAAKKMAEIHATLTVLMPKEFWKDLNVESISEMNPKDFKELSEIYNTQIKTWFNDWSKMFNEID